MSKVNSLVNKILEGVDVRRALVESSELSDLVSKLEALADDAIDLGYDQSYDPVDCGMNITADDKNNCIYVDCYVYGVPSDLDAPDDPDDGDYYDSNSRDFLTGPFYALLNLSKDFLPAGRYYCGKNDVDKDASFKTFGKVKWDAKLKGLLPFRKVGVIKLDV